MDGSGDGSRDRPHRSGFACLVGRPNAGKSTLVNALVGDKVAITSSKPQTTRHAIRGIVHRADGQLVMVDTPGLHRPRTLLGQRLNDIVRTTWAEVDAIGLCLPADEETGPGDRFIAAESVGSAGHAQARRSSPRSMWRRRIRSPFGSRRPLSSVRRSASNGRRSCRCRR